MLVVSPILKIKHTHHRLYSKQTAHRPFKPISVLREEGMALFFVDVGTCGGEIEALGEAERPWRLLRHGVCAPSVEIELRARVWRRHFHRFKK